MPLRKSDDPVTVDSQVSLNDKDKWSGHLEFCKLTTTLATALLTATVVIYSDETKIPSGVSLLIVILCDVALFMTLLFSVSASAYLSNLLVNQSTDQDCFRRKKRANMVTILSGLAFSSLVLSGLFMLIFFLSRATLQKGSYLPVTGYS